MVEKHIDEFKEKHPLELTRPQVKDVALPSRQKRIDLSMYNLSQYREERKKELLEYMRKMDAKYTPQIELLTDNQIVRFEIIHEEEKEFKKLRKQYKEGIPIAIETLQQIVDPRIIYERDYAIKVEEYDKLLKDLQKYGDAFLNEFLAYIEFHEQALQLYKQQTNDMYIELGFATNATYTREIEDKQQYLDQQER